MKQKMKSACRKFKDDFSRHKKNSLFVFSSVFIGSLCFCFLGLTFPITFNLLALCLFPLKFLTATANCFTKFTQIKTGRQLLLGDLPDSVKWATISAEDKDFYTHHGFSITGMIRASFNILFKQKLQGGSTISQQLVKTALLTPERTIRRKIREFVLTLAVEIMYPKDKILEMYLNQIPYGGTAWGIESAANLYFSKHAKDLNLEESALLAGFFLHQPAIPLLALIRNWPKKDKILFLTAWLKINILPKKKPITPKMPPLNFAPQTGEIKAPHFVMYVKDQLTEKYGQRMVEQGGLRVKTTLDLDLQNAAQKHCHRG